MARWAVTLICSLGVLAAVGIVVRHGGKPRQIDTRPTEGPVGAWPGAARGLRAANIAVLSGALSAFLVLGLGGRLMMRVAAATSKPGVQGAITDAEEVVGEVTIGGSIGLVLFITLLMGGAFGVTYALLRRFLPGPAWMAGLIPAVLGAGLFGRGSDLTNPDNKDFTLLDPKPLLALMLLAMIVLAGMTLGATYEWLSTRVPLPSRKGTAMLWYLPIAPLVLMPLNPAALVVGGAVGAVAPASVRDWFRSRTVARVGGTLIAIASALAALRVGADLLTIAF